MYTMFCGVFTGGKRGHDLSCGASSSIEPGSTVPTKKPRMVFTEIQRRTLVAIFREIKRPSKEIQATIAEQLGLKVSTVVNFFMNARRRSVDKYTDDTASALGRTDRELSTVSSTAPGLANDSPQHWLSFPTGLHWRVVHYRDQWVCIRHGDRQYLPQKEFSAMLSHVDMCIYSTYSPHYAVRIWCNCVLCKAVISLMRKCHLGTVVMCLRMFHWHRVVFCFIHRWRALPVVIEFMSWPTFITYLLTLVSGVSSRRIIHSHWSK